MLWYLSVHRKEEEWEMSMEDGKQVGISEK